jgi:MFS family permease
LPEQHAITFPGNLISSPNLLVSILEGSIVDGIKGIQRKITRTLFISQSLISAALITTGTVNSIAGAELSGVTAWAGIPVTVILISSALGAYGWGLLMEKIGRRKGLSLGLIIGALGAALSGAAIWQESFLFFLTGMALIGLGQSAMMLSRFAAAEVHSEEDRGKAIANVVLGGTVGSVLGPTLVAPAGVLAVSLGLGELVGPYGTALVLFLLGSLVIVFWLKPDPMDIARKMCERENEVNQKISPSIPLPELLQRPGVIVATLSMVIGQAVMVMIMVITSLHMKALTHTLGSISVVISAHSFGMYAFSVLSGRLTDRIGREKVIIAGAFFLILAGLSAGLSPNVLPIAISLFLLGLGWNLCFVGGSTLLTDQLSPGEQSRTQGINDLFIGLASAGGSLGSGFVFAAVGYQIMGLIGAGFAVIPLLVMIWWMRSSQRKSAMGTT